MDKYFKLLTPGADLEHGAIVRRVGNGKDQQGGLLEIDDDGNLVLIDIIDMAAGNLFAAKGLLKPKKGDVIYYSNTTFKHSQVAGKALKIIKESSLYKENPHLHRKIIDFITTSFVPEQIVDMDKNGTLKPVFVPLQEKFRIGRFTERRDPIRVCTETFGRWLDALQSGIHITYIAQIMQLKGYVPRFYSDGTKPHEETMNSMREEIFNFEPNYGGHIKCTGIEEGIKRFMVDAGSNVLGRGVKTPLHVSQTVAAALKKLYPDFEFDPVPGRGAFGTQQSY
jgi:hypothetical protein